MTERAEAEEALAGSNGAIGSTGSNGSSVRGSSPAGAGRPAPVVAVVGRSGAGKTSLLERLIPAVARRGLAVGAVKHASHGFAADRPGKDSHRLYESGAGAVAVASRDQVACFARTSAADGDGREVSLDAVLSALPAGLDVVLAEGFSWEPVPRVVVRRESEAPAAEHVGPGPVLAIVTVQGVSRGAAPAFDDTLVATLVEVVCRAAGAMPTIERVTEPGALAAGAPRDADAGTQPFPD